MQRKSSDSNSKSKTTGLVISKAGKQKLSKSQAAFNKLTQRIERLQNDIAKKEAQFDLALKIWGNELHPARMQLLKHRYDLIIALWEIYQSWKLSKKDQRDLKKLLQFHLQEYFAAPLSEPDILLQQIFSAIEGMSYEQLLAEQKEEEQEELKIMFAHMNVNIEGLNMDDEAAVAQKLAEARQKLAEKTSDMEEEFRSRKQKKSKTNRQVDFEKQQRLEEEMKQKNIGSIYKQLAKLFHPDLEQDPERRAEKEILIKELTAAYEAKNLHALLLLELKWIHNENSHLESISEDKLAVYLEILKEQAAVLEMNKARIIFQPRYAALTAEAGTAMLSYPVQAVNGALQETILTTMALKENIAGVKGGNALRYVKTLLKEWKQEQRDMEDDEALNWL